MIKTRMRWAGHAACTGKMKYETLIQSKLWLENLKGRGHSEDLGIDRMILLEYILEKQDKMLQTGFIWLRTGTRWGVCQLAK
jgi:hypothetical protein